MIGEIKELVVGNQIVRARLVWRGHSRSHVLGAVARAQEERSETTAAIHTQIAGGTMPVIRVSPGDVSLAAGMAIIAQVQIKKNIKSRIIILITIYFLFDS
tara:strand:+ start:199 stop:501 length:303 start_codon:yes stop_codon:yes gene_type:complete